MYPCILYCCLSLDNGIILSFEDVPRVALNFVISNIQCESFRLCIQIYINKIELIILEWQILNFQVHKYIGQSYSFDHIIKSVYFRLLQTILFKNLDIQDI